MRTRFAPLLTLLLCLACSENYEVSRQNVDSLFARIVPVVEAASGISLGESATCRLVTPDELTPVLMRELSAQYRNVMPDPEVASDHAERMAGVMSRAVLGKYSLDDRAVLICPENFNRLASFLDEPGLLSPGALASVLVHELIHLADAVRFDFPAVLATIRSEEELNAYSAVVEGHAQLLARRICRDNGWEEGFATFTRSVGKVPDTDDPGQRLLMDVVASTLASAYYDGERFMATLEKEGAVARAFASPPGSMEIILHPEWYLHPDRRPRAAFDVDAPLEVFQSLFDEGWTLRSLTLTRPQAEAALSMLDREEVVRIVEHLKHNRAVVATPDANPQSKLATAVIYEFDDAGEARNYLEAALKLSRIKDERMKTGSLRIVDTREEPVRGEGWEGVRTTKKIETGSDASPVPVEVIALVAVQEELALEVLYSGKTISREEMIDLADRLFSRARPDPESP